MKNKSKIALAAVVFILIIWIMPMIFALMKGNSAKALFKGSLALAIIVPFLAYGLIMISNGLSKKKISNVKNIIFDVGGVLVDFDWDNYLKTFNFPTEEYNALRGVFLSPIWEMQDKGELPTQEYIKMFQEEFPQYKNDVLKIFKDLHKTITIKDYAITWLSYLKDKGYSIYIISNYGKYLLDETKKKMKFLKFVDDAIFSCDVNIIKPDKKIFQLLLDRHDLMPEDCVFIDDTCVNIEAARELGIHGIHFLGFKEAAKELENLGIK